jgi:hypothetical protein
MRVCDLKQAGTACIEPAAYVLFADMTHVLLGSRRCAVGGKTHLRQQFLHFQRQAYSLSLRWPIINVNVVREY